MEKKKEDSGKRLYFTSDNGECSSYSIVSGAEKLDEYSKTRTLPQGEKTIDVVIKLPALRLTSLLEAMDLRKDTEIAMKPPFTNLQKIFNGRTLVPLPQINEEEQQHEYYNTQSNQRTTFSGPSSSSFAEPPNTPFNAAPALFLRIGTWQVVANSESDLVLKFDYRNNKISWEIVMEGPSKHKIEIEYSNIIGIQAAIEDHRQGILQLELQNPPRFYKEIETRPLKLFKWEEEYDFTQGRASMNRKHFSVFAPGILGTYYKRLMKNKDLFEVSKKPFPTGNPPYFHQPN